MNDQNDSKAYADDNKIISIIKYFYSNYKLQLDIDRVYKLSRNFSAKLECYSQVFNSIFGLLKKSFQYPNVESIKLLYTSLVRPHFEYANSFWCQCVKKDLEMLEKTQPRAIKLVQNIKRLNCQERLYVFGLTDLKIRMRDDLIQMFKITNKKEKIKLVN